MCDQIDRATFAVFHMSAGCEHMFTFNDMCESVEYIDVNDERFERTRECEMRYQTDGMMRGWWKCSECHEAMDTIESCGGRKPPKWCGNCGARVRNADSESRKDE